MELRERERERERESEAEREKCLVTALEDLYEVLKVIHPLS